jgi:cation diffusion facilitator CzcD-associated flavoprotein CzcO
MGPAAQVDYNPKIKRTLNLSVVQTLNFTAPVACVKFSQDGNYFAVATDFDETHIYDVVTMSTG